MSLTNRDCLTGNQAAVAMAAFFINIICYMSFVSTRHRFFSIFFAPCKGLKTRTYERIFKKGDPNRGAGAAGGAPRGRARRAQRGPPRRRAARHGDAHARRGGD